MIPGLSGSLLSHDALEDLVRSAAIPELACEPPASAARALRACHLDIRNRLGPSSGSRTVFDLIAEPLVKALGFVVTPLSASADTVDALLQAGSLPTAVMIVTPWGQPAGAVWRHAIRRGLAHGIRWCLCFNGPAIRLIDTERAYARRFAELELDTALDSPQTLALIWAVLQAGAMLPTPGGTVLDRVVAFSEGHRAHVRRSLRDGVHDALRHLLTAFRRISSKRHSGSRLFDESLIVIYRILFLLFAEARGLVPAWHPVYREGYTIEALRTRLHGEGPAIGVWEALQAIARLAHRGCHAGTLRVPPFNGRLFSPADAPLADTIPLDDHVVSQALTALTTRKSVSGPQRISYADLGVEQLGGVYEHLLDYDVATTTAGAPAVLTRSGRRKATGSFYTPRSLTEFLVRRTLAPIVREATSDQILALRVLDAAMGSGAFLVAACRYLAAAYEHALVREGALAPADIEDADRAAFRRVVAQKCLFGVDVNPMAVQLARLSLWLATLAADKPLSFFDHHLRSGNSLVGASIDDILRNPAPGTFKRTLHELPLFQLEHLQSSVESAVATRQSITDTPDDTLEQVRQKEKTLSLLNRNDGPLDRWKSAANLWCAAWYPEGRQASGRAVFRSLLDSVFHAASTIPPHVTTALLERSRQMASDHAFFHWTLEFPEVFYDERGRSRPDGGFDVVVGNPPWEVLREDSGSYGAREHLAFTRDAGVYPQQGRGHGNMYQLFLERVLTMVRRGGRIGLILPAGFATDRSAATLRRGLFDRTSIDTFTILDNRDAIFPIHRALRFLLLALTNEGGTSELPVRAGIRSAETLDRIPDVGVDRDSVQIPRMLIERIDRSGLAVPDIRSALDLDIVSTVSCRVPALSDIDGWGVHFGRELNATDDRPHFREGHEGLPLLEGKQLRPFAVDTMSPRYSIDERVAATLLNAGTTFRCARLAYRDVASSTNRMTLIAAIVPAGVVTTHTIFCLKDALDARAQQFLCGVFNSYVANYFVRLFVGTHVTAGIIARLPVPRPESADPLFIDIARISGSLGLSYNDADVARLNARVAKLYGLSPATFAHVLRTFPLVPEAARAAALRELTLDVEQAC